MAAVPLATNGDRNVTPSLSAGLVPGWPSGSARTVLPRCRALRLCPGPFWASRVGYGLGALAKSTVAEKGTMVVVSFAVSLAVFVSPPPATWAVLVTLAGAVGDTPTVT